MIKQRFRTRRAVLSLVFLVVLLLIVFGGGGYLGLFSTVTLEEVETRHILATLRRCRHNQSEAARILGIGRNTLWRKRKKIREARAL